MLTEVCDSEVEFVERPFVKPLKLSSGTITTITEARNDLPQRPVGLARSEHRPRIARSRLAEIVRANCRESDRIVRR